MQIIKLIQPFFCPSLFLSGPLAGGGLLCDAGLGKPVQYGLFILMYGVKETLI